MILFYGVSSYLRVLSSKHGIFYGVSISARNAWQHGPQQAPPRTLNVEPRTSNLEGRTFHEPLPLNFDHRTLIVDPPRSSTLESRPSALESRPSYWSAPK